MVDIGPKGLTTSAGSDGSTPHDRIERYGKLEKSWADSCIFGAQSPLEALERLIVCDGQQQRGFRKAIFNPDFKSCGICCDDHLTHENIIQLLYVQILWRPEEIEAKYNSVKQVKPAAMGAKKRSLVKPKMNIECEEEKASEYVTS